MVMAQFAAIPATIAGNTLVACVMNGGGSVYINSTGASIGVDAGFLTTRDGRLFSLASAGPANQADSDPPPFGQSAANLGHNIQYLENIPGGVTQIFVDSASTDIRIAVYELSPCRFDVAGNASVAHASGGVEIFTGAITPTTSGCIAFGTVLTSTAPTSSYGASWPIDMMAPDWPHPGTTLAGHGFVILQNGVSGAVPVSFTGSGTTTPTPNGGNGIYLACFKPAITAITLIDRAIALGDSGVLAIRTTDPGDLLVVLTHVGSTLTGGSDTFIPAGSTTNFSIWYCVSLGGTSSITFSSTGGILAYQFAPPSDFGFAYRDFQSGTVTPFVKSLYGQTTGLEYDVPVLTGDSGPCVYVVVGDQESGTDQHYLLSYDWRQDPNFIGSSATFGAASAYMALDLSGAQRMSFWLHGSIIGAQSPEMMGIAIGLDAIVASTTAGGIDLNTFLPNVWIIC
jgi:hypothetical protein